jgi:methyltransferase (TIGR00027 family)
MRKGRIEGVLVMSQDPVAALVDWSPEFVTRRLHAVAPILGIVGWRVLDIEPGYCRSVLPLTQASTNHNCTHQAALISMVTDFTGGIASTCFLGYPIAGLHTLPPPALRPQGAPDDRGTGWAVELKTSYKRPSTDDLLVEARLAPADMEQVRARFVAGRAAVQSVTCRCVSGFDGNLVAEAHNTYLVQQIRSLRPSTGKERRGTLFVHMTAASARLIAGIRARSTRAEDPRKACLHAALAGPHGVLLAERFAHVLPELEDLVRARGRDLDTHLAGEAANVRQVVFAGVGLDLRPLELVQAYSHMHVFEVDLPEMLEERRRRLAANGLPDHDRRHQVAANLEHQPLSHALAGHVAFDPAAPTIVVFEGISMYLEKLAMECLTRDLESILAVPGSSAWMDTVDEDIVEGAVNSPPVTAFLDQLALLGEPFRFGLPDADVFFAPMRLVAQTRTVSAHTDRLSHPIFDGYRFHTLRARPDATSDRAQ